MYKYAKQITLALLLVGLTSQIGLSSDEHEESNKKRKFSNVPIALSIPYNGEQAPTNVSYPVSKHPKTNAPTDMPQVDIGLFSLLPSDIRREILGYSGVPKAIYGTCKTFRSLVQRGVHFDKYGRSNPYFKPPFKDDTNQQTVLGYRVIADKMTLNRLGKFHTLDLSECYLGDVVFSNLSHVSYLILREAHLGEDHNIDLTPLGGIHTIDLSQSPLERIDLAPLGRANTLDLSGCTGVYDVSKLGGVTNLDLEGTEVEDVSALVNVHTLHLSECTNVKDISKLSNVKHLILTQTMSFSALSLYHLMKINPDVIISFEPDDRFIDPSWLGIPVIPSDNDEFLDLRNCRSMANICNLISVKKLLLPNENIVEDILKVTLEHMYQLMKNNPAIEIIYDEENENIRDLGDEDDMQLSDD